MTFKEDKIFRDALTVSTAYAPVCTLYVLRSTVYGPERYIN